MSGLGGDSELSGFALMVSRFDAVSKQIAENPTYAEATCKMLFAADPEDRVVKLLLGDVIESYAATATHMQQSGELSKDVDAKQLAQDIMRASRGLLGLWLKGFVSNSTFQAHCRRALVQTVEPALMRLKRAV